MFRRALGLLTTTTSTTTLTDSTSSRQGVSFFAGRLREEIEAQNSHGLFSTYDLVIPYTLHLHMLRLQSVESGKTKSRCNEKGWD